MNATMALSLGALLCFAGASLEGCQQVSGSCEGKIDGDLYALRIFNCTDGLMTVKVNDRMVGTVEAMDEYGTCGVTDFGTFPQCSTGRIEAYSYNSVTEVLLWNEDAVSLNPDGCWLVATILGPSTDPSYIDMPPVDAIDGPECLYLEKQETH